MTCLFKKTVLLKYFKNELFLKGRFKSHFVIFTVNVKIIDNEQTFQKEVSKGNNPIDC